MLNADADTDTTNTSIMMSKQERLQQQLMPSQVISSMSVHRARTDRKEMFDR
jgi:hypothetical protein